MTDKQDVVIVITSAVNESCRHIAKRNFQLDLGEEGNKHLILNPSSPTLVKLSVWVATLNLHVQEYINENTKTICIRPTQVRLKSVV